MINKFYLANLEQGLNRSLSEQEDGAIGSVFFMRIIVFDTHLVVNACAYSCNDIKIHFKYFWRNQYVNCY